jgi:hypothetical protein
MNMISKTEQISLANAYCERAPKRGQENYHKKFKISEEVLKKAGTFLLYAKYGWVDW